MKTKLFIILLIPFLLCGCFNYHELENLSICTAMAFDIKDNNYEVSYMVANSRKTDASTKEGQSQAVVYTGSGKTVSEAIDDLITKIPQPPYISHLETIVVSEDVAKNGVLNILDYLMRHPESRKKFYLVLTKEVKASDVLKILSPLSSFPSNNILSNVKSSAEMQSITTLVQYNEFIGTLLEEGVNPILSSVTIEGDVEEAGKSESLNQTTMEANVIANTVGLFKDDKLITFATLNEDLGINFIRNEIKESVITLPCEDNYLSINIEKSETKFSVDFIDDKPKANVNVKTEAVLNEVNCKIDIKNSENLKKISDDAKKLIDIYINEAIMLTKNEKTDIFGFGTLIHKNYPKKWKNLKENWDEEGFVDMEFDVKIDIEVNGTGSLKQTLEEMK